MNWKIQIEKHLLKFKRPSGTSRGVLTNKKMWLIRLDGDNRIGIGECSIIPGLSPDYQNDEQYEAKIQQVANAIETKNLDFSDLTTELANYPSILFGFETAHLNWVSGEKELYFRNSFSEGNRRIPINGLIWMGDESFMQAQITEKMNAGFTTLKMKIGAIDLTSELRLLQSLRKKYKSTELTLRVDANGAFTATEAKNVLEALAELDIHSIEQPIQAGDWEQMALFCRQTPTPIALDEELIGIHNRNKKIELLQHIQPQYIILKPSLHGGIHGTREWITIAEDMAIPWWMTSALESNVGLKAICDLAGEYDNALPQGLGTGSLYEENFPSSLVVQNGSIYCSPKNY